MRTHRNVRKIRRTRRRRGGDKNQSYQKLGTCEYNLNDVNARVNSEDAGDLKKVYDTCCPKTRFGFKNSMPFCKNLSKQYTMLQEARNYETKEIFEKNNDRYLNSEDEDYYKPRNAIMNPEGEEFGEDFQGSVTSLGGKYRKMRKSRKSRKMRKSRKSRK